MKTIYLPFLLVLAIFLGFVGLVLFARPQPPIQYAQAAYAPERPIYAPGESMVYSPTLKINVAGRIDVFRSFWNRTQDASALLCSGQPAPTISVSRNFPPSTVGNVRGGARVQLLIPDLPPGDYWLISTASGPGVGQSSYVVPFAIRHPCGSADVHR